MVTLFTHLFIWICFKSRFEDLNFIEIKNFGF